MSHGHSSQKSQNGSHHLKHQEEPIWNVPNDAKQIRATSAQPSYAHRTTIVMESQMKKKLPTLVLKLQQRASFQQKNGKIHGHQTHQKLSDLSDRELDEYLASNLQDFKRELMSNIDNFHQMVLSAKPNPAKQKEDPEGYKIHLEQYRAFLELANEIVKRMQDSFNDILMRFREHIDQLWIAICEGQDVQHIQHQFGQFMQQNMDRYWKPVFDSADQLIAKFDINVNQH